MAGRKSKTATAAKPKRQAKAGGKTAAKANPARSKNDRAVDHVVAAAKSIKKSAVKAKSKQSTASQSPSMGGSMMSWNVLPPISMRRRRKLQRSALTM